MKTRNFPTLSLTIIALPALALAASITLAQDSASSTTTTASTAQPVAVSQTAPQLSYGVPEVLQLSQAKVGDSVIVNYIQNSGNNYGLNATQIIYLRQQGVSDTVINAMLNQRSQSAQTTTTSSSDNSAAYSSQTSTAPTQPAATYVQTVPASTVYVVPDTQTYYYNNWLYSRPYYYFGNYPAYGYCWPYPAVSVSYGWGGYWGGYRGGWHVDRDHFRGGWHGGGGWHSSGGWHGSGGWHH